MIREKITDPWREVSWDEAFDYAAAEFERIKTKYGRDSIGGITSSRCTNEETYLVQKLIRAGFGNNNVDTCARVCHSPTGYGLATTFGTSAGTQDFDSVEDSAVMGVMGANPPPPPLVFFAHEEAAASGRQADRDRSAAYRNGGIATHERAAPAADAGHQRGGA